MSVQGQLYNSYDNFASGQLYASVGDVGNVSQHQANQFMQVTALSASATASVPGCMSSRLGL